LAEGADQGLMSDFGLVNPFRGCVPSSPQGSVGSRQRLLTVHRSTV